jgi:hypothetical protein
LQGGGNQEVTVCCKEALRLEKQPALELRSRTGRHLAGCQVCVPSDRKPSVARLAGHDAGPAWHRA